MKKILFLSSFLIGVGECAFAQNTDLVRSLNIADSLATAQNYLQSDAAFSEIIKIKPDWAVAYGKRALVRLKLDKLAESRADIAKAQTLDATNRLVVAAKKKYDEAVEPPPKMPEKKAPEPPVTIERKPETSRTAFENPRDSRDKKENGAGWSVHSSVHSSVQPEGEAPETNTYQPAVTRKSPPPNARAQSRGQKIAYLSDAIRQNPNDDQAYAERGLQYGILGNDAAALQDYNTALQINPNNANAYYLRGVYYVTKGSRRNRSRGCADLQRALSLGMPKAAAILRSECR